MKQISKKLLAVLLTVMMLLSLLPTTVFAEGISRRRDDLDHKQLPTGYIPTQIHGTQAVTDAYLRGDMEEYYRLSGITPTRDTLPSKYDSRDYSYVTSVKNQNPYGSCWAHAAMGSVESYMIKHGIPVGTGAAATTSLNLSETQHCFFNYTSAYDAEGMLTGDKSTPSDGCLDQGGNGEMSAYTLQRWTGVADESVSALAYSKASTVASSGLNSQYAYASNVAHVQNSVWIPATNIEAVKQAIMEYGAGNISYYESGSAYTYNCTIDTSSQESSSHKWANHAITIVGWDDSIATSNFKPNTPSGKGAWICKNSWGTGYFSSGYCYISYEDTSVLEGSIFFYDAEPIDNYAHNYQYDGSCNLVCYGKGWPSGQDYYVGFANNTQVANVFTAKGNELLRAIAFCSWDEALTYTVEIYKNPTTGNPSSGTLMTTQTGSVTFPGYYTIPLDNPVALGAGDTFAVVITQNVAVADDDGNYVHTPYDATFNNSDVVSWCSWVHANHGNTSYYKEPNGSWTDCPDNGDYRIKAYTDDVTFTVTAVSNNTSYGTVSVSGSKITATPKTGYYVESCDVISGTATCTINGNTITVAATEDCTIRVNFAPKPTYTVNFIASGNNEGSQSALVYDEITLPATVSTNPDGWTFAGWMTQQIDETTDEPAYYAPGAAYTVTGNTTLYALFTRVEGSDEVIYQIVADNLTDWTGNYVITSGKDSSMYVLKGLSGNTSYESASAGGTVTFANSGMTLDGDVLRNVGSAYVFAAASTGSAYTLQNASTGTYVGSYNNYLYSRSSYSSSYCNWALEYDLYNICMKVSNSASSNYPYMAKGSNSYFVVNSSYTTNKTQFWKETNDSTTYYWTDPVVAEHEHDMEYVAAVAPTCGADGHTAYYHCTLCGKYFSDAAGENEITLESTVIPATGNHTFGSYVSNNDGTHKHVCSVCGAEETENCTYTDVVTAPTATEQGYTTHTCTVCGYSYVDSYTAPLGSDYPVHFSVPEGVTKPADMVSNTNTGITLPTVEAPEGYTFLGWVVADYDNVTDKPTQILTGTYIAPQEITLKALFSYLDGEGTGDVTYELVTAAPTDWAGNYVITYGTDSSLYAMKGVTVSSNGADIEANTNAAALSATGMTLDGTKLTNVSSTYLFNVAASGNYYTIRNASTNVYVGETSSNYLGGYNTYTSGYCDWTLGTQTNASSATCVNGGNYPYLSYNPSGNYFWTQGDNGVSNGYVNNVRWWKETQLGTTYYTTVIEAETPHEHTMTHVAAVAATCATAGNIEYWYCADCGKYFSDAQGNTEITLADTVIPATGNHTYGEYVSNNDGTHKHVCSVCGDTVTENCTYNDVVTAPTATEGGYTTHTCTVCGYSFVDSYTDPLGNDFLVSFSVPAGVTAPAAMTCHEGGTITLPTAGAPDGYTFLGWVVEDYNNVSELPTVLTGAYAATASITLKALYSKTETTAAGYELVTGAPTDWTGSYVITYGKGTGLYALKGLSGNKKYESATAGGAASYAAAGMTLNGNVLTDVNDAYVFQITAASGKYAIKNAATGTYLASKGSYLYSYKTNTASYCRWSLAMNGEAVDATNAASRSYSHLSFATANYFMLSRSAGTNIYFWKLTDGGSSTVYTTVIG